MSAKWIRKLVSRLSGQDRLIKRIQQLTGLPLAEAYGASHIPDPGDSDKEIIRKLKSEGYL